MVDTEQLAAWFTGRIPDGWFTAPPEVVADRDEILVTGEITAPDVEADEAAQSTARRARIQRFREETRDQRIQIASEVERRTGKKVAWAARCACETQVFTSLAVPVMTRLRMGERKVLDTLVAGGVARSRADALAWCVRLVRDHEGDWIRNLQDALVAVDEARAAGPNPAA
jgi:hypothetical protein